jgi:hypothetical protein
VSAGFSIGVVEIDPGIHLSSQMEIVDPSPTRFINPVCNASLPATIAFQVADEDFGTEASRKLLSGKYLPFRTRAQRDVMFVIKHKPCFPNRAKLNRCRSRKPIPPFILGIVREPQETQCKDLLSSELLHQNLAIAEARLLQTFLVRRKHIILKVGIACITDFRRTSLAAHARCFSDHPYILLLYLSPI